MAYSYVQYTANGSTQTFSATFPFINADHVEAYVDNVEDTTFTWPTTATITLSAMPANGAIVRIKRVTPKASRLVDFIPGNTVSEDNLDTDSEQNFYSMQETLEAHESLIDLDLTDDKFDADTKIIKNVVDPTSAQDAVTKNYVDVTMVADIATAVTAAELAETNAETAQTAAELAETNAGTAKTAAELAETNAETAKTAAELAETNAETAQTAAELAETNINATITTHRATANEYSKTQNFNETLLTSSGNAVAWDLESNQVAKHTLTENTTFSAPTNHVAGAQYRLTIIQEATERTVSWNAAFEWENDTAPDIPAGSGDLIVIVFDDDGAVLRGKTFYTEA